MKIIYDLFPAKMVAIAPGLIDNVTLLTISPPTPGSFLVDRARILITPDKIMVAVDSPEGATIIFQEQYTSFEKGPISRVVTISGKMVAFEKDANCGCGSRLRSWNPTRTLYSMKDFNND